MEARIAEAIAVGHQILTVRNEEGDRRAIDVSMASIAASVTMLEDLIGPMKVAEMLIGIARRSVSRAPGNDRLCSVIPATTRSTPFGR